MYIGIQRYNLVPRVDLHRKYVQEIDNNLDLKQILNGRRTVGLNPLLSVVPRNRSNAHSCCRYSTCNSTT